MIKEDCSLCTIIHEKYRVVQTSDLVYSVIPHAPLFDGHVMVLPKSHSKMKDLCMQETYELNNMIYTLKDTLVRMYPDNHPFIFTLGDTDHASISEHLHYHLVPSKVGIRTLTSTYYQLDSKYEVAPEDVLTNMATKLRDALNS
tara:strand:- start:31066 stop:31497 length:432 start_codon:yes stop_codon:yes gene_type:complete